MSGRELLDSIGAVGQGAAKVGLHTVWQSYSQVNAVLFLTLNVQKYSVHVIIVLSTVIEVLTQLCKNTFERVAISILQSQL